MSLTSSLARPFGSATAPLKPSGDGNGRGAGAAVQSPAKIGGKQSFKSNSSSKPWYNPQDIDRAVAYQKNSGIRKMAR